MAKILIIEDDEAVTHILRGSLSIDKYTIESVINGTIGLEHLLNYSYDLAIIDWNLPELSGPEICQRYRAQGGTTAILMLTSRVLPVNKAEGLDAGADDYLTKPFDLLELNARVRALMRRSSGTLTDSILKVGLLSLDLSKYEVLLGDVEIKLVPKEFSILELLMRNAGRVLSAEQIINQVWKSTENPTVDSVRTQIKNIRKKIELVAGGPTIETIHGIGYKMTAKPF